MKQFRAFCSHGFFFVNYNLSHADLLNNQLNGFLLKGLVRAAPRYPVGLEGKNDE